MVAAVIWTSTRPGSDVGLQAVVRQQVGDGLQFRTDERDECAKPGLSDFFTGRCKLPADSPPAVENFVDTVRKAAELLATCQDGKIAIRRMDIGKCP